MIGVQRIGIAALVLLLAIFDIYRWGFHKGWQERDAEMQAAIAAKNEESRQLEQRLIVQVNNNATQLQEANRALDQKQSALTAAIRAGRVRLPAASCVQTTPSATPAPASPKDGAESDEQTLLLIAQIAADGDRAINQLNACIDSYNQVREQLNGSNR